MLPNVSIIILNWNNYEDTIKCLVSVFQIDYPNYQVIVVDNASSDDSVKLIGTSFPDQLIIENSSNLGFAAGNNVAINYAVDTLKSDYVFLLNNDTIVDPFFLTELINVAECDKTIGIVGPMIFHLDSDRKSNIIESCGITINWWSYPGYHANHKNFNQAKEFDCASGCAMLIRTDMPIHSLNATYYFGCEDIDLCLRAKKYGYKIVAVPTSYIWHKGRASRSKRSYYKVILKDIQTNLIFVKNNHLLSLPLYLIYILSTNFYYLCRKIVGKVLTNSPPH
jgi:GT2 family glycosyltransferase